MQTIPRAIYLIIYQCAQSFIQVLGEKCLYIHSEYCLKNRKYVIIQAKQKSYTHTPGYYDYFEEVYNPLLTNLVLLVT